MRKKTIITYGTFDLIHHGHIRIFKKAKALGDYLIVGLSTDNFNKIKGKESILNYLQRKEILESIKYIDKVIPERNWNQKINDIKKYKVDVFTMGGDWRDKFNFLKKYCEVKYLPRTKNISTSLLKKIYGQSKKRLGKT